MYSSVLPQENACRKEGLRFFLVVTLVRKAPQLHSLNVDVAVKVVKMGISSEETNAETRGQEITLQLISSTHA